MNYKLIAGIALICFIAGFAVSHKYAPVIKTEIQEKEVIKNNVVTVVKEIVKPDGTKEVDTTTTDTSTSVATSDSKQEAPAQHNWFVAAGRRVALEPIYTLEINRRMLGPLTLGIHGATDGLLSVQVGFEF